MNHHKHAHQSMFLALQSVVVFLRSFLFPVGMNWIAPYLSESGGHSNATWNIIMQFLDR